MATYKALKHTIRGKAGALIEVHGNDVKTLQRLGVIGDQPHTSKAEKDAPDNSVKIAQLKEDALKLTAEIEALKAENKSTKNPEKKLAAIADEIAKLGAEQK